MKIKITFLSFVLLALSTSVFAQKQDAKATVEAFYKFHFSRSGIFKKSEIKAYSKWFSGDLNALFHKELQREAEYLKKNPTDKPYFGDGFPFQPLDECDSGGKLVKNAYTISTSSVKDKRATVEVKFSQPKDCGGEFLTDYKIELINMKGKWLIADWIYSDASTLTGDLKRVEY